MKEKKATAETLNVEDKQLRSYELVLIVSPEVIDEAFSTTIDNVGRFITEKGGMISSVEQWGKRRLAYPIGRFTEGTYVLTQFRLKPELSKEIEAKLRISEEILRHLLTRVD